MDFKRDGMMICLYFIGFKMMKYLLMFMVVRVNMDIVYDKFLIK